MSAVKKLILNFQGRQTFPTKVEEIRDWLISSGFQDEINIYPVDMDQKILKGLMRQYTYRHGVYSDPIRATDIGVAKSLNKCWERFVCCKEMIHILDDLSAKTVTPEEIDKLTFNLSSPTGLEPTAFPADFLAEQMAIFKALAVLAPIDAVEKLKESYENGTRKAYDIALFFRIPEVYVSFLFSTQYKTIVGLFSQ